MIGKENIWPKKLTVDTRIVRVLSNSTYEDFPNTLREIIMNSYDADATTVKISIDKENEIIEIEDNGRGMNESDFDFYLRIAGKTRGKEEYTSTGRRIVGKFGVGFLSIFPFCKSYSIETTKKGTSEIVHANIPSQKYFSPEERLIDVDEIPIHGGKRINERLKNKQFTIVKLNGFTNIAKAFFEEQYDLKNRRNTIYKYSPLKLLKWKLSEDLPLRFDNEKLDRIITPKQHNSFDVFINGEKLYRNYYADNILETHEGDYKQIGRIKFRYFFATNFQPISPNEGRFLKLRNLNVGVGDRDNFDIGTQTRTYAYIAHITGEVDFIEGMNDLIAVSRNQFNFHPDYEKIRDFLRERTTFWLRKIEEIARFERESEQVSNVEVIKNIENLDDEKLEKDIHKLEEIGFNVKRDKSSGLTNSYNQKKIFVDKKKKEIFLKGNISDIKKVLQVNNLQLQLGVDSWDLRDNEFHACKKIEDKIFINRDYPLFKGKKYVDLFVKFHLMIFLALENGDITLKAYKDLQNNILINFSNYI